MLLFNHMWQVYKYIFPVFKFITAVWLNNLELFWRMKLGILEYSFSCSDFQTCESRVDWIFYLISLVHWLWLYVELQTLWVIFIEWWSCRDQMMVFTQSVSLRREWRFSSNLTLACLFTVPEHQSKCRFPTAATCGLPSSGGTLTIHSWITTNRNH